MQKVHRRFDNQLTNIFKISLTLFIKGYSETQKDAIHEKYFNFSTQLLFRTIGLVESYFIFS